MTADFFATATSHQAHEESTGYGNQNRKRAEAGLCQTVGCGGKPVKVSQVREKRDQLEQRPRGRGSQTPGDERHGR